MPAIRKIMLLCASVFVCASLSAQLEVTHLFMKGYSANGLGLYLNFSVPVSDGDDVTAEFAFYYFSGQGYHLASAPILGGYRHTLDGSGTGFYVEPAAGYTFGGTDIQKSDANGSLLYNTDGSQVDQKNAGITGALGIGYIFQVPLNIGVRYSRVFVSGDPGINLVSLRLSYMLSFGRRGN